MLLVRLDSVEPCRRRLLAENLASVDLARALAARSWKRRITEPEAGLQDAQLACVAAQRLDDEGRPEVADVQAHCWAVLGNALRIADEFMRAEEAFAMAREVAARGSRDRRLEAFIESTFASLLRARRRIAEARALYESAARLFREIGDRAGEAGTLISAAIAVGDAGEPHTAIRLLTRALSCLGAGGEDEQLLERAGFHAAAWYLTDAGYADRALCLLLSVRDSLLAEQAPTVALRVAWLHGHVAAGLGQYAAATKELGHALEGFTALGKQYESALLCLELGALQAEHGEAVEAAVLANQALTLFSALGIGPDAAASMLVLEAVQAARDRRLTVALLREATRSLRAGGR